MTHGFFIIMGGFNLFERSSEKKSDAQCTSQEDNLPLHPLLASDLMHDNIYSLTMPTEAEIKDRGKSDSLAKSLVLLQTSWFVMQCIGASNVFHSPISKSPPLHMQPWISQYIFSSGTSPPMSTGQFECSENPSQGRRSSWTILRSVGGVDLGGSRQWFINDIPIRPGWRCQPESRRQGANVLG